MHSHEAETTVGPDGSVRIEQAPFPAGSRVRVIMIDHAAGNGEGMDKRPDIKQVREQLRGSVGYYRDPHGAACDPEQWEALSDKPADLERPFP